MIRKPVAWRTLALGMGLGACVAFPDVSGAQEQEGYMDLSARVWLDQGDDAVLQAGDRVRIYYQTSHDAYVAVFQITTDGVSRLMYPAAPHQDGYTRGGRDYRVLLPESPYWYVDDTPGLGYFFIVASPEPMDFSAFDYSRQDGGWDLSSVGRNIYTDPYLAMDDVVAALIPDWEYVPYALDFLAYDVGEVHDYPRFLCYDCHGYRPYYAWNPYQFSCVSFRLVIWDDPFYYPAFRYSGTRVVWTRPVMPGQYPRFSFKERADGEPGTPEVLRRDISAGSGTPVPSDFGSRAASALGVDGTRRVMPSTAVPSAVGAPGRGTYPKATPITSSVPRGSGRALGTSAGSPRGIPATPPGGVGASGGIPLTDTRSTEETARVVIPKVADPQKKPIVERRVGSGSPTARPPARPPARPSARLNTTQGRSTPKTPAIRPGSATTSTRSGTQSSGSRPPVSPQPTRGPTRTVTPQRGGPTKIPSGVKRTPVRTSPPVPTKRPPSRPPPKKKTGGGGPGGFNGR